MGPIDCPETSASNYQSILRNNPQGCKSHLRRGRNLKLTFVLFAADLSYYATINFALRRTERTAKHNAGLVQQLTSPLVL